MYEHIDIQYINSVHFKTWFEKHNEGLVMLWQLAIASTIRKIVFCVFWRFASLFFWHIYNYFHALSPLQTIKCHHTEVLQIL